MLSELSPSEYNPYYAMYIEKAMHKNIVEGLGISKEDFIIFVKGLSDDKLVYAYEDGKWTIAEVLLHLIDTERIFVYRALRFARNDKSPLVGFDQDAYVPNTNANDYTKQELIEEFTAVRNHSIALFKSFTATMSSRIGEASGSPMSARAVGYIITGHQIHHFTVIKERYV